jgi:type VI secretion system secreted protein Hcp
MPFLTFIKIPGIAGESKDKGHAGWIEAHAVNFTVSKGKQSGYGEASRVKFDWITVWKAVDISTPPLVKALCTNQKLPQITIEFCRAGAGDTVKYMEWKLTDCQITDYHMKPQPQSAEVAETLPIEEFSFDFSKIEITYLQQKRADGSIGGQTQAAFDLKLDK